MARVLVRVKRVGAGRARVASFFGGENFHHHPQFVLTDELTEDEGQPMRAAEFFEVEERDVEAALTAFAQGNPGCEVQAFTMTHSGICPAGDFVMKKVSKEGVLPA